MSSADINHTEEMERAYWEAYVACKFISPVIDKWDFLTFCEHITKVNNGLLGPNPWMEKEYDD